MSISSRTRSKLKHREESSSLLINLPEEVHDEIFLKVPAKSILSIRCVCKLFYNLLSKPSFIKNHLNLTNQDKSNLKLLFNHASLGKIPPIYSIPIDYTTISSLPSSIPSECDGNVLINYPYEPSKAYYHYHDLLGSSNGLICLSFCFRAGLESGYYVQTDFFGILNPLTKEFKQFSKRGCGYDATYGFGYDSSIDDYKLVIISDCVKTGYFEIDVYIVRSDSWRNTQTNLNYSFRQGKGCRGVFLNGALHWLGTLATQQTSSEFIVSFDISSETIEDMPLPESIMSPVDYMGEVYKNVGLWGDCICVACIWDCVTVDVWVMQEYGVKESWTKRITTTTEIPGPFYVSPFWKPLWCFDNGEILIDNSGEELLLYDPASERVKSTVICDANRESYVESLVSLDSGTYMEKWITGGIVKSPRRLRGSIKRPRS